MKIDQMLNKTVLHQQLTHKFRQEAQEKNSLSHSSLQLGDNLTESPGSPDDDDDNSDVEQERATTSPSVGIPRPRPGELRVNVKGPTP